MLSMRRVSLALVFLSACGEVQEFSDSGVDGGDQIDGSADPTAPETTLTVTPDALSNQATPRFEFMADRPATFTCKLDGGAPAPCTSPHTIPVADGPHVFEVFATSEGGVADPTPALHTWRVDTVPPDTTIDHAPAALDNSTTVQFDFHAGEEATFTCTLDGAAQACGSPHTITGLAEGAHTLTIRATDLAGNVELAPAAHTWSIDTSTPDTQIDAGPTGAVATTSAELRFSSSDAGPGATFECALDAAAFAACTSPRSYGGLAEGDHAFRVRVRDATGNYDPTPAERFWTVDTTPPTVSVTSIATPTSDTTPTLQFTPAGAPTMTECRMDGAGFGACTTATSHTPAALGDGTHTLEVRVTDAAGNTGTGTGTVTVDTVAPTVTIAPRPSPTSDPTPGFTFSTAGNPTSTQCRHDASAFGPCTTSTTYVPPALGDGAHTIEVRATDAAGNTGSATAMVTVDTVAPTVTITPFAGPTSDATPTFTFATAGGPTNIQCRIDAAAFAGCSSATSHTPAPLADGTHTLEVRVTDAAGNTGSDTGSVTVDTTAPTIAIGSFTTPTSDTTPTFPFSAGADAVTVQCRMDGAGFAACSGATSHTPGALTPDGNHTFEVRVADALGNTRSATAVVAIDTVGPSGSITSGPAQNGYTNDSTPTFGFVAGADAVAIECRMDSGLYAACPSSTSYTAPTLSNAVHTFSLRLRDAVGNYAVYTRTFTVDTVPPTLSWGNVPPSPNALSSFTYTWSTAGGVTQTECRPVYQQNVVPAPAYVSCSSGYLATMFNHSGTITMVFTVRIRDAAGNLAVYEDFFSHYVVQ